MRRLALAVSVAFLMFGPAVVAQNVDQEAIAKRLVAAAGIHEGDLVLVFGGVRDVGLLEDIAIQTRATGAFPLLALWSQRLSHDMYAKVPERFDSQPPAMDLKLAEMLTAVISVDIESEPGALADIPAARRAASAQAGAPVGRLMMTRGVRQVNLGNGLYPTAGNATLFGISRPELEKVFWAAVAVEPSRLQAAGTALKTALGSGRELRLTGQNGTDLRMGIAARPVFVSDGFISPEEAKTGGAACSVWLPAGELYLAPVPGTAEGTVVVDRVVYQGQDILGLSMVFKAGRLVSISARGGAFEPFKALYDVAGAGKDAFALIDFGLNPALQISSGSRLQSYVPAGMVSVGIGDNTWAGGTNESAYGFTFFLPGSTVTVDGKPIVEKGVLKQ